MPQLDVNALDLDKGLRSKAGNAGSFAGELAQLGFSVIPYGITLVLRAAKAMQDAMTDIVSGKFALWKYGPVLRGVQRRRRLRGMGARRRELRRRPKLISPPEHAILAARTL